VPSECGSESIVCAVINLQAASTIVRSTCRRSPPGDEIAFNVEHIAQIVIKRGHPLWCDCAELKALVSEAALATESGARWIYREAPDNPDDSGWRVFEGSEDDAFANDARNIRLVTVGSLIDRDPTLAAVFREEHGKACERTTLSSPWRAAPLPQED